MKQSFRAFRIHYKDGHCSSGFETLSLDCLTGGDVVIKAVFSCVNYKDALAATGKGKILKKSPLVGGIDVSGYVENSDSSAFEKGDPVLVCGSGLSETRDGGYAEYVRVPASYVIALPDGLTLFEAMAIGSAGFTSALAIDRMQSNGQTPELGPVVVSGATGGVGSYAIDLLARLGFDVVAITGKPDNVDYLSSLGAMEIRFRDELSLGRLALEKGLWGGAVDSVGGDLLAWLTRTVKPMGNIAAIGLAEGIDLQTTVMPFILRGINLLGINSVICPEAVKKRIWKRLAGDLHPQHIDEIVTRQIYLDELPKIFQLYLDRKISGRTVVKIG